MYTPKYNSGCGGGFCGDRRIDQPVGVDCGTTSASFEIPQDQWEIQQGRPAGVVDCLFEEEPPEKVPVYGVAAIIGSGHVVGNRPYVRTIPRAILVGNGSVVGKGFGTPTGTAGITGVGTVVASGTDLYDCWRADTWYNFTCAVNNEAPSVLVDNYYDLWEGTDGGGRWVFSDGSKGRCVAGCLDPTETYAYVMTFPPGFDTNHSVGQSVGEAAQARTYRHLFRYRMPKHDPGTGSRQLGSDAWAEMAELDLNEMNCLCSFGEPGCTGLTPPYCSDPPGVNWTGSMENDSDLVYHNGKIYFTATMSDCCHQPENSVYKYWQPIFEYNISLNSWRVAAYMPSWAQGCGEIPSGDPPYPWRDRVLMWQQNGYFWFQGGSNIFTNGSRDVWRWHPETDTWNHSRCEGISSWEMPWPTNGRRAGILHSDGYYYVMGGDSGAPYTCPNDQPSYDGTNWYGRNLGIFRFDGSSWEQMGAKFTWQQTLHHPRLASVNDKIYISTGRFDDLRPFPGNENCLAYEGPFQGWKPWTFVYDPVADTIEEVASIPVSAPDNWWLDERSPKHGYFFGYDNVVGGGGKDICLYLLGHANYTYARTYTPVEGAYHPDDGRLTLPPG